VGAARARRDARLRVLRRQDLRPDFQKYAVSLSYLSNIPPLHPALPSRSSQSSDDGQWGADIFEAHAIGCNAVSWAPAVRPGTLLAPSSPQAPTKRFASAGCDNVVKIWAYADDTQAWAAEEVLEGHADWVRDVAWAPHIGLPRAYLATASQDKTVLVWTKDAPGAPWVRTALDPSAGAPGADGRFPDVVWRVSWSLAGNVLAVSCGDGKVTLWKENLRGGWACVSDVTS
jgi:protein transport protein SEC13